MKLSDFKKKRVSKQELETLLTEVANNLKYRPESERRLFGAPIRVLFSHILWLDDELTRVAQGRFEMQELGVTVKPEVLPSNQALGRVVHPFPPADPKVYAERGARLWELFQEPGAIERYQRVMSNAGTVEELRVLANDWAARNGKPQV